jgi:hypothetical protein
MRNKRKEQEEPNQYNKTTKTNKTNKKIRRESDTPMKKIDTNTQIKTKKNRKQSGILDFLKFKDV